MDARQDVANDGAGDGASDATADIAIDGGGCDAAMTDAAPGTLVWAENFGLTGVMYPTGVAAVRSTGEVVVTGGFTGTVSFGSGTFASSPGYDAAAPGFYSFVTKLDECGGYEWAKSFGDPDGGSVQAATVAVGGAGQVVIAGIFQGSVSFGGTRLDAPYGSTFVAAYDSTGTYLWSKRFDNSGVAAGLSSVAVDSSGNVVLAGTARNGLSFGGPVLTGYYLVELGPDGAYRWGNSFVENTTNSSNIAAVEVDPSDNVILAGTFTGPTSLGGPTLNPPAGAPSAFVAKYDSSGNYLWAEAYPGVADDGGAGGSGVSPGGLAVDSVGNIFVAGLFNGTIDFGTGAPPSHSSAYGSLFLARIGAAGTGSWAKAFVGSGEACLASAGTSGVTLATLIGGVDFGGGVLDGVPGGSVAIADFDSLGSYQWSVVAGAPSTAVSGPNGLAGSANRVVALGTFAYAMSTLVIDGKELTSASQADLFLASFVP